MSSDEALAGRAKRLSALSADRSALLREADAFVVVSWWQEKSGDGREGHETDHLKFSIARVQWGGDAALVVGGLSAITLKILCSALVNLLQCKISQSPA